MSKLAQIGNMPEILRISKVLSKLPQATFAREFFYLPGVAVGVMYLPAGSLLTGKIHKHAHIAILAEGTLRLADDNNAFIITAPYIAYGKAGIKRLGYAETDCTFINVLSTDIVGADELDKAMVVDTFEAYEAFLLEQDSEIQKQLP
jgi:hypothetical protein